MKRCARCKEELPREAFGKRAAAPDGLHPYCRECNREYGRQRYATHGEDVRAAVKAYRERNADAVRERDRERYLANRESRLEAMREYGRRTREERAEVNRAYRLANKDKWRVNRRRWRAKRPFAVVEQERRRRARVRGATTVPVTEAGLAQRIAYYGYRCWVCAAPWQEVDHVKPLAKGGAHMLSNLRPICRSCNAKKNDTWPFVLEAC